MTDRCENCDKCQWKGKDSKEETKQWNGMTENCPMYLFAQQAAHYHLTDSQDVWTLL